MGIIFIDEIDKVATNNQNSGQDVSRQGVQRDILPILEGSMVQTKYGTVNTEHMLFIGAGAFHVSKPSDLIPELQGRFPIRVELESLSVEDFVSILTEPKLSLIKQYEALLQTEQVTVNFTEEAIKRLAEIAFKLTKIQIILVRVDCIQYLKNVRRFIVRSTEHATCRCRYHTSIC